MRLLITANSPGEVAGWASPLASAWHSQQAGPIDILLLPCAFATGQEERVSRQLIGVERIYQPKDYFNLLLKYGRDYYDGALLHLGGDLMYSALLSWRHRLSAWSYLWARPWWNSAFTGFFTKDDWGVRWLQKRKVPNHKIHCLGDLVLDSVRQHVDKPDFPTLPKSFQISYMPGSREIEVAGLTPLFLGVHKLLIKRFPDLEGVLHLSPFLPPDKTQSLITFPADPKLGGVQGKIEGDRLTFQGGSLKIATTDSYQLLNRSALALSIPGTKTAEAGYLRTPVLTLIPLNRPEHLPSIGLLGLLDFIPGGNHLKGQLMLCAKPKIGLLGQPNILAGEPLLPEILDTVNPEMLAEKLIRIIASGNLLTNVQQRLQSLYPWHRQPAQEIVAKILATIA